MRKSEGKGLIERLRERFLRQNGEKNVAGTICNGENERTVRGTGGIAEYERGCEGRFEEKGRSENCVESGCSESEVAGRCVYDEDGVRAYLSEHGEVLERLVSELRRESEVDEVPILLGRGARVVTRTPSDKPRSIADAGEMAEQYFRRTHI